MADKKILLATTNKGKLAELEIMLRSRNISLLSLQSFSAFPDVEENGSTFEENALIKANAYFKEFNIPTIADDSGLCVDFLDGRPGIHSVRYSGQGATDSLNIIKLLNDIQSASRPVKAHFHCSAIYVDGEITIISSGKVFGTILSEPKGTHGFGYDPVFLPNGYTLTMAELGEEVKNKISHRAKAMEDLIEKLNSVSKI